MNFLQVGVKLKAENVQSFIDDFFKIDGVTISGIELQDDLILINKIKYKSLGTISVGLKVERIENGILSITIKKVKAINIPINVIPINFILKMVLGKLNVPWISCDGKHIRVDLFEIFNKFNLDFLVLDIKDIKITKENISIMIDNINLDMKNILNKDKNIINNEGSIIETKVIEEISDSYVIENVNDINYEGGNNFNQKSGFTKDNKTYFNEYSRLRYKIYNEKFKNVDRKLLGQIIFLLPDIGVLCYRLIRDNRVKRSLKILLMFTLVYLINPLDKISSKLSILNKIDNVFLVVFSLNKVFTSVDKGILEYHFDGNYDTLNFLIDSFDILNQFSGGENIDKLYFVFEKFTK